MESSEHNPKSELKDSDCEDDQWDIFQTGDDATEEDDKLDGEEACENLPRDYLVDLWPFARPLRCLVWLSFELHWTGPAGYNCRPSSYRSQTIRYIQP